MSDETTKLKLTPDDPIDAESMQHFNRLEGARYELGGQLLNIEQERVRLLAAAHTVDTQRQRLFEKVLMERGLPPTTQVEIDSTNGKLRVLIPPAAAVEPPKA